MIVVVIIGILAGLAWMAVRRVHERSVAARITNDVRQFRGAFASYHLEKGSWPPATAAGEIPDGMQGYLGAAYLNTAEPGGAYSWAGDGVLEFTTLTATERMMRIVDEAIDDGDLSTGDFSGAGTSFQLQF